MKNKSTFIILALILILFNSCENLNQQKTIKLAHGLDTNHPVHNAMVFMGQELEKNSGGTIKLEIYPNQQLGSERQCLELLQIGSLDMTKVSAAVMENFSPNMKVLGLPFLFKNKEHTFKVLDGEVGKSLLDGGKKYWLKGLGYYDAGSRSFYTKKEPILKPENLDGLKIRVMESVTAMNMVSNLGGSPTPISAGELYTALQQGVVDGAENNPPSFTTNKHYEVCKHFSRDAHTMSPDLLLISTKIWSKLDPQVQGWLQQAASESSDFQRELWTRKTHESLEQAEAEGVSVYEVDKNLFAEKVQPMYEAIEDKTIKQLVQQMRQVTP